MNAAIEAKPLGRKAYGSIGHLPASRLGPGDHCISEGQARICTEKARDSHDIIIVQEKVDGSCCAVARVGDTIHALQRRGYLATTSPYVQHHYFATWVAEREELFRSILNDGERLVGEWVAQACGTRYILEDREPFFPFDLFDVCNQRLIYSDLVWRLRNQFEQMPFTLSVGEPCPIDKALAIHESKRIPGLDPVEGVVYRVERKGRVDFLAKFVRPEKVDGCYLPEITGADPIWHWRPRNHAAGH